MNSITLAAPARAPFDTLFERQPKLARFGFACLGLAAVFFAMIAVDQRTLGGAPVWLKPAKFALSIGVFALTSAWFFGLVRPERRESTLMRRTVWVLMVAGGFELAYIAIQGALGQASHYNLSSAFFIFMYAMMGVGAVSLTATTLPLAWEIARRPAEGSNADYRLAVVIGLILTFVLGTSLGGYMSAQTGHSVGAEAGGIPLFGWNRAGGDLRISHFFGIHAQQAIPLLGAVVAGAGLRRGKTVIVAGAAAWVALTLFAFVQAVAGRPFPLG